MRRIGESPARSSLTLGIRPPAIRRLNKICVVLPLLGSVFITTLAAQTRHNGPVSFLGNGEAMAWVEVDQDNVPLRVGVTLTEGVLVNLPAQMSVKSLELPRVTPDSLFKHVMFDWAPNGHAPSTYTGHPHFDFHFFMLERSERIQIEQGNDETAIPQEYMPADYIPVPGLGTYAISEMGVHFVDTEASELNGHNFTNTLIYGFYHGEMIFVEPMVTVSYLETHPNDERAIKQPLSYQKAGYYPTSYVVQHDDAGDKYDVYLTDFVHRDVSTNNAPEADASAPDSLTLLQNYPNPFDQNTTITYRIPRATHVLLEVYDILGRRIATLVDRPEPAGTHSVTWDGRNIAPGSYQYRLVAGDVTTTRQMSLAR